MENVDKWVFVCLYADETVAEYLLGLLAAIISPAHLVHA